MKREYVLIDKRKEELACDMKLSGDTFIRMMSSLENVIYRGCKLPPQGIFSKYDENNSGIIKDLDKLRRQLKIQIKVFLASYEDMIQKNKGEYPFPLNFPKVKVNKLIEHFKNMAIKYKTGDEIYCLAIECIFKGEFDKVYNLLPHKMKKLGMDPEKQIKYFTTVNGKVYETTQKAINEFRDKGAYNHVVDIEENKINNIINQDPICDIYRIFKLFITYPKIENENALFEKIEQFYEFHQKQVNGYLFPKNFEKEKFISFLANNIKTYPANNAFYFYSLLIMNILHHEYEKVESMLNQ